MEQKNADEIINGLIDASEKEQEGQTETPLEDTKVESKEASEEEPEEEKPAVDQRTAAALALFDALNNPETAGDVALALIDKMGLKLAETPKEVKAQKDAIEELLEEALGDEYPNLSLKLGAVIKKAIKIGVDEGTKDLRQEQASAREKDITAKTETALNSFLGQFSADEQKEVNDIMLPEMNKLAGTGKYPIGTQTPEEYFETLYAVASRKIQSSKKAAPGVKSKFTPERGPQPVKSSGTSKQLSFEDVFDAAFDAAEKAG